MVSLKPDPAPGRDVLRGLKMAFAVRSTIVHKYTLPRTHRSICFSSFFFLTNNVNNLHILSFSTITIYSSSQFPSHGSQPLITPTVTLSDAAVLSLLLIHAVVEQQMLVVAVGNQIMERVWRVLSVEFVELRPRADHLPHATEYWQHNWAMLMFSCFQPPLL